MSEVIVGEHYALGNKIGTGSFGDIYEGQDIETKQRVAIKLEPTDTRYPQLKVENYVYEKLAGATGIPHMYYFGKQGRYFVMVMELLGKSLDELCDHMSDNPFTTQQVFELALQILDRLELVHSKGLIYRDIKPANFLFGLPDEAKAALLGPEPSTRNLTSLPSSSNDSSSTSQQSSSLFASSTSTSSSEASQTSNSTSPTASKSSTTSNAVIPQALLYLIDFGLCKPFNDGSFSPTGSPMLGPASPSSPSQSPTNGRIKAPKSSETGGLVGTARYASIAAHRGRKLSQKDDLESVGYVLLYMLRGELPWQTVRGRDRQEIYDLIAQIKKSMPLKELCKGFPALLAMMTYVRSLEYGEPADYTYLKSLFSSTVSSKTPQRINRAPVLSKQNSGDSHGETKTNASISPSSLVSPHSTKNSPSPSLAIVVPSSPPPKSSSPKPSNHPSSRSRSPPKK